MVVSKMLMDFAFKTRNCVSKTRNCVLKMRNLVFRMMDFAGEHRSVRVHDSRSGGKPFPDLSSAGMFY